MTLRDEIDRAEQLKREELRQKEEEQRRDQEKHNQQNERLHGQAAYASATVNPLLEEAGEILWPDDTWMIHRFQGFLVMTVESSYDRSPEWWGIAPSNPRQAVSRGRSVFSWQIVGSRFPRIEIGQYERSGILGGEYTYYVYRQYLVTLCDFQNGQYRVFLERTEEKFNGIKAKQKSSLVDRLHSMSIRTEELRNENFPDWVNFRSNWIPQEQFRQELGRKIADELERRKVYGYTGVSRKDL